MSFPPTHSHRARRSELIKATGFYLVISSVLILACVKTTAAQASGNLVTYPNAKIEFIIGPHVRVGTDPLATFYDDTAVRQGRYWAEQFLNSPLYVNSNHYDLPLCLYILYYRTGDPAFLDYARRVADRWWKGPHVREGLSVAGGGDIAGPMYTGVLGLALYALDGHPEVFGYLDRIGREWMNIKLLPGIQRPEIYTDLRDEGYAQLLTVTLAKVLPDTYTQITWDSNLNITTTTITDGAARRARYLADSEAVAVGYFGRVQHADGGWRWNLWVPPYTRDLEQPFMLGIYLESVIRLHQLTTNQATKDSLTSQLTRAVEHLYRDTYRVNVEPGLTSIPRVTLYFWPLALNSQDYQASDRHLTTSQLHAFGYAYKITGDARFKTWGDEMWDSCYDIPGDGYRALIEFLNYPKLFTMEARSAGNYLAWRQGGSTPPPPNPVPSNPIDATPFFVRQQYLDFLNREPDPGLYATWQQIIDNCQQGDTTCDRIHVSLAFFRSAEFQGRGYFVYRFYPVSLGRKPDFKEFTSDIAKVSGFLTDAELESAKVAFITEFMSRPGFVTKFNGLTDTQYVDALLATAGVTSPHRDFWIAALGNGTRTRATVLRDISESTEVYDRYYNHAFVVMQYFGYLRRDPDASYLDWIEVLNSSGDYRGMVNGFMNSLEYRSRWGS